MDTLPAWFVVVMGMSTVFVGLFLIILLCKLLSFAFADKPKNQEKNQEKKEGASARKIPDEKREILLAAAAVAIAEECGRDPAGIRVLSFKRINDSKGEER